MHFCGHGYLSWIMLHFTFLSLVRRSSSYSDVTVNKHFGGSCEVLTINFILKLTICWWILQSVCKDKLVRTRPNLWRNFLGPNTVFGSLAWGSWLICVSVHKTNKGRFLGMYMDGTLLRLRCVQMVWKLCANFVKSVQSAGKLLGNCLK